MFVIDDLLIVGGVIVGGLVAWAHWDEIKAFIRDLTNTVIELFSTVCKGAWHAVKVFAQITRDGMVKILHKLYYIKNGRKTERTKYAEVEMQIEEFPADVQASLRKAQQQGGRTIEVTEDMERALDMKLS